MHVVERSPKKRQQRERWISPSALCQDGLGVEPDSIDVVPLLTRDLPQQRRDHRFVAARPLRDEAIVPAGLEDSLRPVLRELRLELGLGGYAPLSFVLPDGRPDGDEHVSGRAGVGPKCLGILSLVGPVTRVVDELSRTCGDLVPNEVAHEAPKLRGVETFDVVRGYRERLVVGVGIPRG